MALSAVPAHADDTPGPGCPTITDPEGDQGIVQGGNVPPDTSPGAQALDLRSVSVGSTRDDLVVTIRVTDINDREPVYMGHIYTFWFAKESTRYAVIADLSSDGNDFYLATGPIDASGNGTAMTNVADIQGTPQPGSNSVRMTVPLALLRRIGATGRVTQLEALAGRQAQSVKVSGRVLFAGHGGLILTEDTATTPHSYRLGTRGCL